MPELLVVAVFCLGFWHDLHRLFTGRSLVSQLVGRAPSRSCADGHRWRRWQTGKTAYTGTKFRTENGYSIRQWDRKYRRDTRLCRDCPKVQYREVELS